MSRARENRAKARKRGGAPRTERQRAWATFCELGKTEPIEGAASWLTYKDPITGEERKLRVYP